MHPFYQFVLKSLVRLQGTLFNIFSFISLPIYIYYLFGHQFVYLTFIYKNLVLGFLSSYFDVLSLCKSFFVIISLFF